MASPSVTPEAAPAPTGLKRFGLGSLRGVGQVDFQPSVWTSLLILAALWVESWEMGLFATIGAVVSTLTAQFLNVHHDTVVAAVMCTLVTATLGRLLAPFGLKAFTGPFCFVALVMVLGAPSFERVWHGTPATAITPAVPKSPVVSWTDLWQGFFANFSQIFFAGTWYVGLIMLVGLFLAGWKVGIFAVIGSVVGLLTAWALGAPAALIGEGIYGYNAVLTSLAFGVVLLRSTPWNHLYTVVAAAASTGLTASLSVLFKVFGSHTFTWPFNITTWALLAAVPLLPRITLIADDKS